MSMVGEVCAYIHNFFEDDPVTGQRMIYPGHYRIENGTISLPFMKPGQYIRIFDSELNDGVHQYGVDQLTDEVFTGVVWKMRPPMEFLELVTEIEAWQAEYGAAANSPYQSEDVIGVYRYTKGSGAVGWRQVFGTRLKPYFQLP